MYRDILEDLKKWKDKPRRKPLLLAGVRQCGKTYIVGEFAKECFDSYVYLNFEASENIAAIFEYDFDVKRIITDIAKKTLDKGISEDSIEILAPMYKGEIGIDNLNIVLQSIFNPHSNHLKEVVIGDVIYRINDKVLNLVNDPDKGVYNGDIGYIYDIDINSKSDFLQVDFYGNIVSFKREDLSSIKHAYVISIHKAQGSEFDHVIIPISMKYNRMLYNKLIYTGVSRAKKSLTIIGSSEAFNYSVSSNDTRSRKTSLKSILMNKK